MSGRVAMRRASFIVKFEALLADLKEGFHGQSSKSKNFFASSTPGTTETLALFSRAFGIAGQREVTR